MAIKKQVLIVNSDVIASGAFQAGKFGFVENGSDFSALNSGALDLSGGEEDVSLFYGTQNVGPISEGDVKKVTTWAKSAGTAQSSTAVVAQDGTLAEVKIINTTAGTMNLPVKTFESVGAGSANAAAAAIKALMDTEFAKSDSPFFGFGASVSSATITITAPINSHFRLAGNDATSFAYGTAAVPSIGLEADVKKIEKEGFTDSGVFGRAGSAATFKTPESAVSGDYTSILIEGTKSSNSKAVGIAKNYDDFAIWVFVKHGNSTLTPANIVAQVEKLKA